MRLIVAFALVAALAAATTGALTYREARTGVLQQSQDTVITMLRTQIGRLAPALSVPPRRSDLQRFAADVAGAEPAGTWRVLVVYGALRATSAPDDPFEELTPALRAAVDSSTATVF
ncbi:two-component sensor histidine kinase, partial [Streptomyces sp. TRM76130]|nr:two-component sensor histidine kinase [Streptomyces sp. TRM76130]